MVWRGGGGDTHTMNSSPELSVQIEIPDVRISVSFTSPNLRSHATICHMHTQPQPGRRRRAGLGWGVCPMADFAPYNVHDMPQVCICVSQLRNRSRLFNAVPAVLVVVVVVVGVLCVSCERLLWFRFKRPIIIWHARPSSGWVGV